MIGVAFEWILSLIFYLFFEIVFFGTGEIILYILTLGKRKPVWARDIEGSSTKLGIFMNFSFIIGFVFWLSFAWLLFSGA